MQKIFGEVDRTKNRQLAIAANGVVAWEALNAVPEPAAAALAFVCLGALGLARRSRRAVGVGCSVVALGLAGADQASAADVASYVASADPGLDPDANTGTANAWSITLGTNGGGSGTFLGFGNFGIGDSWALFSYPIGGVNGIVDADHTFAGGALANGQSVSLNFANSAVATGGAARISLMSAGVHVVTFKYNGNDPQTVYRYDDAGGSDLSTGEPFGFRTPRRFEFSIRNGTNYTASYGLSAWSGTYTAPIDGIRVSNFMGGDASDVIVNNLAIGPTTLVPLSLEVNKTTGLIKTKGNPTLAANLDYYKITSAGNALTPGAWGSLDDQNLFSVDGSDAGATAGDGSGEGWDESDTLTTGALTEYYLRAGRAGLASATDLYLGFAYNKAVFGANDGDLQFVYGIAGGPQLSGTVAYVTGGAQVVGDYNGNGIVDAPDLGVWKGTLGATITAGTGADGNGNGRVDGNDFLVWQRRLGATTAVESAQAVPEPQAFAILGIAALGAWVRRR